jgi:hypothetical protein
VKLLHEYDAEETLAKPTTAAIVDRSMIALGYHQNIRGWILDKIIELLFNSLSI